MKILLVDDSKAIVGLYKQILEEQGYQVVTANSGTEAIEVAQRECPLLGLLDYNLPDFDGEELTRRLLADPETEKMVIAIFSTYSDITRKALDAGARDMIPKDLPEELFYLRLEALKRTASMDDETRSLQQPRQRQAEEAIPFKVMLVDDSRFTRSAYQTMLEENGYEVVLADNMETALAVAREEQPDLAIVDFYMEGGNGDELTRALLADPLTQHVIVMVFTSQIGVKEIALSAGALDVVEKGESQESFLRRVASIRYHRKRVVDQLLVHMQSAEEAKRLHHWVESILNSINEPVLVINNHRKVIHVNPALLKLLKGAAEEVIGQSIDDLFEGEEVQIRTELASFEHVLHQLDGERAPVHVSSAPLTQGGEQSTEVEGAVLLLVDLSERLRKEQQQQFLAFRSGIAEMSASILHHIGNALVGLGGRVTSIEQRNGQLQRLQHMMAQVDEEMAGDATILHELLVNSSLALETLTGSAGIGDDVEQIRKSIREIGKSISVHRSASRSDLVDVTFHFQSVIEDALTLLNESIQEARVELVTTIDTSQDIVEMPRNPALQMVLNLLQNSIDAIIERRIHETDPQWHGRISVMLRQPQGRKIELIIEDNGCGIEAERLPRLFSQGYSTKHNGSGFGLHFSGLFIQEQNGAIDVESEGRNQGATVRVVM